MVRGWLSSLAALTAVFLWATVGMGQWLCLGPQILVSDCSPPQPSEAVVLLGNIACPWSAWEGRGLQSSLVKQAQKHSTRLPAEPEAECWGKGQLVVVVSASLWP